MEETEREFGLYSNKKNPLYIKETWTAVKDLEINVQNVNKSGSKSSPQTTVRSDD